MLSLCLPPILLREALHCGKRSFFFLFPWCRNSSKPFHELDCLQTYYFYERDRRRHAGKELNRISYYASRKTCYRNESDLQRKSCVCGNQSHSPAKNNHQRTQGRNLGRTMMTHCNAACVCVCVYVTDRKSIQPPAL